MSKLALPPLGTMPPAVQAAFRSVAAWANTVDSSISTQTVIQQNHSADKGSSLTASDVQRVAMVTAKQVYTRTSADFTRSILENMGSNPPIMMNSPQLFTAQRSDGDNTYLLGIGAGGIVGAVQSAGASSPTMTFGLATEDGSFFFGANDPANTSDMAHRQIVFDATNNVITFGSSIVIQRSSGTTMTLEDLADAASGAGYTKTDLESDLASGVGRVLSGIGTGYVMDVNGAGSYIAFAKEGAVYNAYSSVADTTNAKTPMMALTANGIAMGYNDIDGTWKNSVVISSADGSVTVNNIKADSGEFATSITVGGTTLANIKAGALAGATALQSVDLSGLLSKSSSNILTGTIVPENTGGIKVGTIAWNSTTGGLTSGSGIAITEFGIVGAKEGVAQFSISASTGDAIFKGNITGATGTFSGDVVSNGQIKGTGSTSGLLGAAAVLGQPTGSLVHGVVGYVTMATTGVTGHCANASGYGVRGTNTGSNGVGVFVEGRLRWGAYTFPQPDGSAQKMLCANGTWSNAVAVWTGAAGTTFTALAGVQVYRLPMTINGVTYQVLMTY